MMTDDLEDLIRWPPLTDGEWFEAGAGLGVDEADVLCSERESLNGLAPELSSQVGEVVRRVDNESLSWEIGHPGQNGDLQEID